MLANIISLSRVLIGILIIAYYPVLSTNVLACLIFVGLATDMFDGMFARYWQDASGLGKLIDPLCDALFVLCLMYCAVIYKDLPIWFVMLTIIRYFIITIMSIRLMLIIKQPVGVNFLGKISVCSLFAVLTLYHLLPMTPLLPALLMVCSAIMVFSLIAYIERIIRLQSAEV
jgi:phosphatidylglycerophosphate synthase